MKQNTVHHGAQESSLEFEAKSQTDEWQDAQVHSHSVLFREEYRHENLPCKIFPEHCSDTSDWFAVRLQPDHRQRRQRQHNQVTELMKVPELPD